MGRLIETDEAEFLRLANVTRLPCRRVPERVAAMARAA